ncbi:ATP10 protein-domain-containing protein [Suillus lakei]|nr:ATP10 protein-domain-containing protein [Suillus lakei]
MSRLGTFAFEQMLVRALAHARWQETATLRRFIQRPGCIRNLTSGTDGSAEKKLSTKASPDELTLPFLQRPLGVKERPSPVLKTWADTREEMMNQETRLAQREHLMKEATKGYFTDLNATRRHGGKTWIAPNVMIREDKALYFPNIVGSSLDTKSKKHTASMCEGRISVISMLSTRMSELYQYVQINLQENLLKSFLVSLFLSSIAKSVPPEATLDFVREHLGMVNKHCRIRWAGCADAKVEETNALEQCTGVLLSRLDKKKSAKALR